MTAFILDGGSPIQIIKIWHFQFQLSQFVTISSCDLHSPIWNNFPGSYFRFGKRVQVTRRNPTTAIYTPYEHVSIFLVIMNPLKCSIGIGYSNHIYVFLFHGNLIFNLRRAPLYYILGSDDKDILKIDIIYNRSIQKRKIDRKCLIMINLPKSSSWSDMTHSQMLGKFEYTLPAKFWRLVGCTDMPSW